ncbi:alpha/beta family hydrolase [Rathayibacter sp. YIM 133350]|uniref:alpha/beta hydrolase family protein n=1 Tax=Rathayibacter sp. YIM 133350 TaxID=3131992 RepID=UPI00307E1DDD
MTDERLRIAVGEGTVSALYARPRSAIATLALAHGAGAGKEHPFLAGLAAALNETGVATLRFDFPYREAGRRMPDRAPTAIAAWRAVTDAATARSEGEPVWVGGKSFGGRMASMAVAEGMPAAGIVFLGYPLHPPGRPERLRDEHLYGLSLPLLFLQGENDPFVAGGMLPGIVERIGPNARLEWTAGGDHSFGVKGLKRSAAEVGASLAPSIVAFLRNQG